MPVVTAGGDVAAGGGVLSVGVELADWAATGPESNASKPEHRIRYFAAIKANRPTKSNFS